MKHAEAGDHEGIEKSVAILRHRHHETLAELLPEPQQEEIRQQVDALVDEFQRIVNGMLMLGDRPVRPSMRPSRSASGFPRCWSASTWIARARAPRP